MAKPRPGAPAGNQNRRKPPGSVGVQAGKVSRDHLARLDHLAADCGQTRREALEALIVQGLAQRP